MKHNHLSPVVMLFIAALAFFPSPESQATPPLLICSGQVSLTFTPGLTNTPQPTQLTATSDFGPCLAPLFLHGSNSAAGPASFTCTDLVTQPFPGVVYVWSDGSTSTVNYATNNVITGNGEIQSISKGTVVAGFGVGLPATLSITYLTLDLLACESPEGLQSIDGTALLVFGV